MARRKQPAISDELLDQLLAGADPKTAFAKDGLLDELKSKRCYYPTPSNFSFFSGGRFVVWRAGGLRPDRWHNACEEQRRQAQSYHRRLPLSYPFRPLEHRA